MRVSQDSRTIKKGEWFVAVMGEHCDGHEFIPEAIRKGAAGVLEEEELFELARNKVGEVGPRVVAVTGSYGKTTTKEAIHRVLSSQFTVSKTEGNLNTPRGIAMEVVNNLDPTTQIFVVEMGMDRLGEIARSCEIVGPEVGVVTAVGEMHLEKLKTFANIRRAKAELLEALSSSGAAVLNVDDQGVREIAKVFGGRKVWYGFGCGADVGLSDIKDLGWKLLGRGNQYAALAAYAVGRVFGVPGKKILGVLENFTPPEGRLNLLLGRGGAKIINDTYNAGPRSMRIALDVLKELSVGRRIVVLGDMLELGDVEESAHCAVVEMALEVADRCVFVGERMGRAVNTVKAMKTVEAVTLADGAEGAAEVLRHWELGKGDAILVKGSRGMRMERVVETLLVGEGEDFRRGGVGT